MKPALRVVLLLSLLALPADARDQHQPPQIVGMASWYGPHFQGRRMANGHKYNMHALTAASRVLPLGSYVEVTHLASGKRVKLQITDRGPYVHRRMIDLSYAAAKQLGMVKQGVARVSVRPL